MDFSESDHALISIEINDGDHDADAYKLMDGDTVTLYGIIDDEEFVVSTGLRRVRVKVEDMPYNSLDDQGYQQVEVETKLFAMKAIRGQ